MGIIEVTLMILFNTVLCIFLPRFLTLDWSKIWEKKAIKLVEVPLMPENQLNHQS